MKQDADSLFNAAYCLNTGTGTDQDLERCVIAGANIDQYLVHDIVGFGSV